MKVIYIALCLIVATLTSSAQSYELYSPDGQTRIAVNSRHGIHFTVWRHDKIWIPDIQVGLIINQDTLGDDPVQRTTTSRVQQLITPPVAIKNAQIPDTCNVLTLYFRRPYRIVFRLYNDAVAYRFETAWKQDSVDVQHEICTIHMPQATRAYFQWAPRWMNNYEHVYQEQPLDSLTADKTAQLPLLMKLPNGADVLFTESDLYDYPGMYFTGNGKGVMEAIYPPAVKSDTTPKKPHWGWDREVYPRETYPYIARTSGHRTYPWRILAFADTDMQLLNNEIVYKLAAPCRLAQTDWIKPGQVAWDWWNDWDITGVDFKAGINTETYKYYIDFAARHHIPYIIMDDGWYVLGDLTRVVPDIDMPALLNYAQQKGVGIILWCSWHTLDQQMDTVLPLFARWGIKGIKVDFMDRDDQGVVNFYWRCAAAAAKYHLLVDFHGAHKPAGLQRTYPNVVNFEGVPGLEQDKWSANIATSTMAVTLPFIRMFAGPMDYTPGAMRNAQPRDFAPIYRHPMSLGTRCQQLAMYVLYDAPLQMLSDNPVAYEKEQPCLDFITSVPTTWDQTLPLAGEVGKYLLVARKKGNTYFIGAMTNEQARDLTLSFSFLPPGTHHIVYYADGVNADRNANDYVVQEATVEAGDVWHIHLAPGGGWVARIE